MRLEALRGSERRVVRIVGMVGLTLDETRPVFHRPGRCFTANYAEAGKKPVF